MAQDDEFDRPDDEYLQLKEQWSPPQPIERIEHPLRAPQFVEQLEFMRDLMRARGYEPWDQHFSEALILIREAGMTRTDGDWDPYWLDLKSPFINDSMAIELVDNLLASAKRNRRQAGKIVPMPISQRMAIAIAVVEHGLPGNSFEAACKRLQRLLDLRDKKAGS